jgi:predicted ATPase/DNA-binding SARP family transcriptional activator
VVRVLLLGPVAARADDGAELDLGPRARRAVLAALAEHHGRVVSVDALTERLWGDSPPATATNILQGYVGKLRHVLGDAAIETWPPGYILHADTDAAAFDHLARQAREAPPVEARRLLGDALALWRGPFAADVDSPAAVMWDERRVAAIEDRIDADLALGHAAHLVAELQQLVEAHPWRERLRAQLALALHAAGRRAEALRSLNAAREQLADAGLEPGVAILTVERQLLLDEPTSAVVTDAPTDHRFIGRASELDAAAGLLGRASLLTIVGPGGVGKTSLARELVRRSGGPLWFVDLAAIDEPSLVASAAAAALSVDERADTDLVASLAAWAATHAGTVILDNCEHVLRDAAELARHLAASAGDGRLRILATSRERLHVGGETVFRLGPMANADAQALFRTRLREAGGDDDDDDVVASLCRRLDHLPLALELAASRAAAIGVANVEHRLDDRLRLLGVAAQRGRHASLRALLDCSAELLDDDERAALLRLSVFAGPFDLDAAERVADTDATCVARLVDKSLVHREGTRFRLLETIQHYAGELLSASGEIDRVRAAHLAWCADLEVLDEAVDAEVRVALDRARHAGRSAIAAELARRAAVAALGRRLHTEAVARAEVAVEVAPDDLERGRGALLLGEIWTGRWRGDAAVAAYRQAIEAFSAVGRDDLAARPRALLAEVTLRWPATLSEPTPDEEIEALINAGLAVEADVDTGVASELWAVRAIRRQLQDRLDEAEAASVRAVELATIADDPVLLSGALDALGSVQMMQERYADADATSAARMPLIGRLPTSPRGTMEHADILMMRSDCSMRIGDFETALTVSEQLVAFETERGLRGAGLARLARIKFFVGQWDNALRDVEDMLADWEREGRPTATYLVSAIGAAAAIHGLRGHRDEMQRYLDLAREVLRWRRVHVIWLALCEATVLLADGEPAAAKTVLDAAEVERHAWRSTQLAMTAEACVAMGDPSASERVRTAFAVLDGDRYSRAILLRASGATEEAAALFASLPCPWQAAATSPH